MKRLAIIFCLVLITLTLFGCGQSGSSSSGKGLLQVKVTDQPGQGLTKILITVNKVEVHRTGGDWTTVVDLEKTFDLMQIKTSELQIGEQSIQTGKYTEVRLYISKAVVSDADGDIEVKVPSDAIRLIGNWDVKTGQTTILTLDFSADEFLMFIANGQDQLTPTIKLNATYIPAPSGN